MDKGIILCFLWICPVFASNVDILEPDSLAYGKTCECGRDVTLSCKFKNKTFAIAWMNIHDISPIAQCIRNQCDINPKYIDQYKISYDETNHIFNLTIIKLTMKDNGRQLVCSDGTNTDSQLIRVKDYEPLLLENTTTGTIQAISGCISNVTKVSFKWIKICGRSKREKEITQKIHNTTTTSCSNNSDCGNDQHIQYSEVISAKASDNGNCYLKIVADYGNEQKESYHTVERYMMENRDEEKMNNVIVVAVILVDFALILTTAIYLIYLHHKEQLINICILRKFITYDKGNSDSGRFSQTNNETYKQSQRESCQKNEEQSKELNSKNEDSQRYNDLRKGSLTQRLLGYDGTEDLTISAPDLNLDFPKHNEEEISTAANDMSVKEPTINDLSSGRAVPGVGDEKDLSSKEQTIIDINPDRDVVENDENQQQYLDDGTLVNDERNDLSAEEPTVNDHDQDVPEIEEVKNLLCKEQTIIDLYPDRDELGNYEKQKHQLAKYHKLDDQILENDKRNELSANEPTGNDHFLGKEVSEIEKEKKLLSKKQTIIDLYTDGDNLESDEKQKYMLDQRQYFDDDMFKNDEGNGMSAKDPTVNDHFLDQDVQKIKEEKKLSSEKEMVIHGNLDKDEHENDEKQKILLAKQHGIDDNFLENEEEKNEEEKNLLSKEQTMVDLYTDRDENEEYQSAEEYNSIDLDNPDEHVLENDG